MTEAEWLAFTNPTLMFDALRGANRATERKLRLFAAACCRRVWPLLDDARGRMAVEVAEGFADGAVGEDALRGAGACSPGEDDRGGVSFAHLAALAATYRGQGVSDAGRHVDAWQAGGAHEAAHCAADYAARAAGRARGGGHAEGYPEELAAQAALLRDVFGPSPRRPLPRVDPSWLAWNDGTVVKLAAAVYGKKDFALLLVLADALEEAGCADDDILAHCRSGGEHVRGCWAVDLILGKK